MNTSTSETGTETAPRIEARTEQTSQTQTSVTEYDETTPNSAERTYGCPFCTATYNHELLARLHVTRSTDNDHANWDGLMPEVEIEILDESGSVVDSVARRPETLDVNDLDVNAFPDDVSDAHKHVLLVAAQQPYEDTYTELAGEAKDALVANGFEPLSYSAIRRAIKSFYEPQNMTDDTPNIDEETEELRDLTPTQQAVVIAHIAHPDDPMADIADRVGCATSYPPQVYDRAEHIISRFEDQIAAGESVQDVVLSELSREDLAELFGEGLLDDVDVPVDDQSSTDTTETGDGDSFSEVWGDPVTTPSTLTASPYDDSDAGDGGFNALTAPRDPDEISGEDSGSEPCEKQAGSRSDPSVSGEASEHVSDAVKGSGEGDSQKGETGEYTTYVSRSAVYRLRDNVRFVRKTLARGDGVLESDAKMWMLAVQIEAEINAILDEGGTR